MLVFTHDTPHASDDRFEGWFGPGVDIPAPANQCQDPRKRYKDCLTICKLLTLKITLRNVEFVRMELFQSPEIK